MIIDMGHVTFHFRCGCISKQVEVIHYKGRNYRFCPDCYNEKLNTYANRRCGFISCSYTCNKCHKTITQTSRWPTPELICGACRRIRKPAPNWIPAPAYEMSIKPKVQQHECVCPTCRKRYVLRARLVWETKTKWRYCDSCRVVNSSIDSTDMCCEVRF